MRKIVKKIFKKIMIPIMKKANKNKKVKKLSEKIIKYCDKKKYNYSNKYHSFMKIDKVIDILPINKYNDNFKIKKSVTIGICVRNCEKYMENSLLIVKKICDLFEYSSVLFYENGSDDNSRKLLQNACLKNNNYSLITEDYNIDNFPRTVRLSRGRNICLNIAKKINNKIYITFDFDNVIQDLNTEKIYQCFQEDINWDAVFANQKGDYYDIWALRTYDNSCSYDYIYGSFFGIHRPLPNISEKSKMKVISAFGGLGIYKLDKLEGCFYYGWKNMYESCEHVHLNKQMINNGNSNLYIIGYLTNH